MDSTKGTDPSATSAVLDVVFEHLEAAAREGGGAIPMERLKALRAVIQPDLAALLRDRGRVGQRGGHSREYAFHRLMVSHFEHLLPHKLDDLGVSRDILPGFFRALDMMLGEETVGRYHDRSQAIVDRIRAERGDAFTWQDVYDDPETRDLVLDPLVIMATYFDNLDRRISWFIDLVNSQTGRAAPATPGRPRAGARQDWRLSEWALHPVLVALFRQIDEVMSDEARRTAIEARYGSEVSARLRRTLQRLAPIQERITDRG